MNPKPHLLRPHHSEVSLVEAQPFQGKKKGADTGIDGLKFFRDLDQKEVRKIIVSVKGGENVGPAMVKDLIATIARDKAEWERGTG